MQTQKRFCQLLYAIWILFDCQLAYIGLYHLFTQEDGRQGLHEWAIIVNGVGAGRWVKKKKQHYTR